jgi:hypothetical protein
MARGIVQKSYGPERMSPEPSYFLYLNPLYRMDRTCYAKSISY